MARQKEIVFVYNDKGKRVDTLHSQTDLRNKYFSSDLGKRPLFRHSQKLFCLNGGFKTVIYGKFENLYFLQEKLGRDDVVFLNKIHNSEFCKKTDVTNEIECFNYLGEKIAEFKNQRILIKLMPNLSQSTISRQLSGNTKNFRNNTSNGLIFKYKINNMKRETKFRGQNS